MRIQHNIMAMNAYRNYNNNTSALSKNLEKLSSGYKINRAGDDAAGLAISEKMRAQITGLETAQKNAKDGISLVQTAEGALTEVHDMLNRMVELANQSANGTYDNTTDRANLQKEVQQLKDEIDRIADSSNFNGIKLLDGSLQEGGNQSIEITNLTTSTTAGTASSMVPTNAVLTNNDAKALGEGDTIKISLADEDGNAYNVTLTKKGQTLVDGGGKVYNLTVSTQGAVTGGVDDALKGAIESATGGLFTVTAASGKLTIKSNDTGANAPAIVGMGAQKVTAAGASSDIDLGKLTVTAANAEKITATGKAGLAASATANAVKDAIFTVNGQKFVLAEDDAAVKNIQSLAGDDVTVLIGATLDKAAGQLAQATGLKVTAGSATSGKVTIDTASGKSLSLQIGDTSDSFNKLSVSIQDMHISSLGISGIDISTQAGAAAAVDLIKNAINTVSDVRGTLGATQNRLDHTINNLSVMQENIQDAESTIRDTDVADEMMAYTKNNILVQSAQAMLAQANQVPQGVLQLLQ